MSDHISSVMVLKLLISLSSSSQMAVTELWMLPMARRQTRRVAPETPIAVQVAVCTDIFSE